MKTTKRKLTIASETIHVLSGNALDRIHGGVITGTISAPISVPGGSSPNTLPPPTWACITKDAG